MAAGFIAPFGNRAVSPFASFPTKPLTLALPLLLFANTSLSKAPLRPNLRENSLGMKFVKLPKGTFYMGGGGGKAGKKTEIKEDFEIAIYTVTQGQWQSLKSNNPSYFSRAGGGKAKVKNIKDEDLMQFPVEMGSWDDTQEFIKKLNEKERGRGWTYRLPTGKEWEYACRGGATFEDECSYHFYFAKPTNDLSSPLANFNGNRPFGAAPQQPYLGRTTKVGSYKPTGLGLYDMHGNMWQWCTDLENSLYRVFRGGCWINVGKDCRTAFGSKAQASYRSSGVSFRIVRVPTDSK